MFKEQIVRIKEINIPAILPVAFYSSHISLRHEGKQEKRRRDTRDNSPSGDSFCIYLCNCPLTCLAMAQLPLTNSKGSTCYPSLRDFVDWVRGRPYASPRRARASLTYIIQARTHTHTHVYVWGGDAHMCERSLHPVCAKRAHGVREALGGGSAEGGSILK